MGVGPDGACGGVSGGGDSWAHSNAATTKASASETDARILVMAGGSYHAHMVLRRLSDILSSMPVIKPCDFGDERVKALLTRHLEGMHANTPPGHVFALDWSGLQKPEISFYALWEGEDLLGFGALKDLEARTGEIKSMRTADKHLRRGVAAMILNHLIAEARRRGYTRVSLETGTGPAFEPAFELYSKYGFIEGEAFGGHKQSHFNRFMHLDLMLP
jgi:putative acetyltransferase